MPSFNGDLIFGSVVVMKTSDNPRGEQQNAYPGLSGLESLDQGLRGRFTTVTGLLIGPDAPTLNALLGLFRSYNDGNAYVLVDSFGNAWSNVKYDAFEPEDQVKRRASDGAYYQTYTARFKHLS